MRRISGLGRVLVAAGLLVLPLLSTGVVSATPASYNDPNFKLVWERTDKPVQDGAVSRSWMWGPETVPGSPSSEPYVEAPGGNRVVQYFDKSRMEVNDPSGDRSSLWFVTNGLLVKEMVSGKVQVGNASFTTKGASKEAVAGDPASANPNAPNYSSFAGIATLNLDHPSVSKTGSGVAEAIDKAGMIATIASPDPSVTYAYFEGTLKHNIPNKFWDFMNQSGLVYWNGATSTDTVVNWVFAMGFPITEAYWTKGKVGGVEKDVLVQLFERRVLTYTPSNAAGFQVEMGNVGQHYRRWRYDTPAAEERIAFVSNRSGTNEIYSMKTTGGDLRQLTTTVGFTSTVGINEWPSWSPDNSKIVFQSTRDGSWEIYVMNADGTNQQRLTFDPANSDMWPSWSPDGGRIMWSKSGVLYAMDANGGNVTRVDPGSDELYPIYSPDGAWYAFANSATGNLEVWKGKLAELYAERLTYRAGTADEPTDWHGTKILFASGGPGGVSLWSMDDDGGSQTELAPDAGRGAYSPDGSRIVCDMNGQIYIMNADGSHKVNITNSSAFDGQPDWSN